MRVLRCPACGEAMIAVEYRDVEVDTCAACGGVWLDGGELEALVGSALPPSAPGGLGPPDRDCPVCVAKLVKGRYGATEVVVDKCPHGDGIWLDAGELEAILASGAAPAPSEPRGHEGQAAEALKAIFGHKRAESPKPTG